VNNFPPLTHIELLYVNLESTNLSAPKKHRSERGQCIIAHRLLDNDFKVKLMFPVMLMGMIVTKYIKYCVL